MSNLDRISNSNSSSSNDLSFLELDDDFYIRLVYDAKGKSYSIDELKRLLNSINEKEKEELKSLVINLIDCNYFNAIEYLIARKYKISVLNNKGQTILHLAFYRNFPDSLIQKLLEKVIEYNKDSFNDYTDDNGLTHFHIACLKGGVEEVKKFIENGADVDANYHSDPKNRQSGFRPLHFAILNTSKDSENIVDILLNNGANVNAANALSKTPLHTACCLFERSDGENRKMLKIIKLLLENKSNPNLQDTFGNTPLHSIFSDYCGKFIRTSRTSINCVPFVNTKLKLELLYVHGADFVAANIDGDTVLHLVINNLRSLRFSSADYSQISFDDNIHVNVVRQILGKISDVSVNAKNNLCETPLSLAVSFMSVEIVKILLNHGADVSDLHFVERDQGFFNYPNYVPNLVSVQHVITIIELLVNEGFELTLEDNLVILKFLIHNVNDCECQTTEVSISPFTAYLDISELESSLFDLIDYGSSTHIKNVLTNMMNELSAHRFLQGNCDILTPAIDYLNRRKISGFNVDSEVLEFLDGFQKGLISKSEPLLAKCDEDIVTRMKSTELINNISLYDVLTKCLWKIYRYVQYIDVDSLKTNFEDFEDMIKGHIAKSLIRNYVENYAVDYLQIIFPSMSHVCCRWVLKYLSNECVLNVGSAVNYF